MIVEEDFKLISYCFAYGDIFALLLEACGVA
jgi:hypothetical protein